MAHPANRYLDFDKCTYWKQETNEWVRLGYDVYTEEEWMSKFGYKNDDYNIQWETFGTPIPLYDDNERD